MILIRNYLTVASVLFAAAVCGLSVNAQTEPQANVAANVNRNATVATKPAVPFSSGFRGVKIGESADEVMDTLGKPRFKDSEGFLYEPGNDETLQIKLGKDSTVTTIAAIFTDASKAPDFAEVFGPDAKPEPRDDGSVYKMVRYADAGYWVSYFKGAGKDSTVALTIQKL